MLQKCMSCFKFKERVKGKTICYDCACRLFPDQQFEMPISRAEIDDQTKKYGTEISARLTRAKTGLRLTDFPIHLHEYVRYRHLKGSLVKVGDRYCLRSQAALLKQTVEV